MQCGLDKGNHDARMAEQEDAFRAQLELGKRLCRPISVRLCPHRPRWRAAPENCDIALTSPSEMVLDLNSIFGTRQKMT